METIDVAFLRQLLKAPKGTPKEMFFLELGCITLRDIIRERRFGFHHYLLNEDSSSMVNTFVKSQLKNRTRKDWVTSVQADLDSLGLGDLTMERMKNMKKKSFMNMIKEGNELKTFEKLQLENKSHFKVKNIEHTLITMQKYLRPNQTNITKEKKPSLC